MLRTAAAACVALLGTGCLPFVTPPLRASAGVGSAVGTLPSGTAAATGHTAGNLRAGAHPVQLFEEPHRRMVDVGVGYQLERLVVDGESNVHGPYTEFAAFPWRKNYARSTLRAGAYIDAELLVARVDGVGEIGPGGTLGAMFEYTGVTVGDFASADEDSAIIGIGAGQWAIGLYAAAGYRHLGLGDYWTFTAGITARIPFTAGIICCVDPFGDEDSSDHTGSSADDDHDEAAQDPPPPNEPIRRKPARPRPGSSEKPVERRPAAPRPDESD
jgi:hypothetical protein